ncbi:hypothetical protein EKO04_002378 [Ascochyta lentis]|uniref:Uncharacterized protein n=1 Tax=Ascochyta lentis TaxID=205686 RepID=A0A8H7J8K9_9PLEO|nr:hypothetical protein EKO04_002378 [Ascochyta lentis]
MTATTSFLASKRETVEFEQDDGYSSQDDSDSEEYNENDAFGEISTEFQKSAFGDITAELHEFTTRDYQLIQEDMTSPQFLKDVYTSPSRITQHLNDVNVIFADSLLHHLVIMNIPTALKIKTASLPT